MLAVSGVAATALISAAGAIVVAFITAATARWVAKLTNRAAAADTIVDVRALRFDELKAVNDNLRADKAERDARIVSLEAQLEDCRRSRRRGAAPKHKETDE